MEYTCHFLDMIFGYLDCEVPYRILFVRHRPHITTSIHSNQAILPLFRTSRHSFGRNLGWFILSLGYFHYLVLCLNWILLGIEEREILQKQISSLATNEGNNPTGSFENDEVKSFYTSNAWYMIWKFKTKLESVTRYIRRPILSRFFTFTLFILPLLCIWFILSLGYFHYLVLRLKWILLGIEEREILQKQ